LRSARSVQALGGMQRYGTTVGRGTFLLILALVGCGPAPKDEYQDPVAFRSEIEKWNVVDRSLDSAVREFVTHGFTCSKGICSRTASSRDRICANRLQVTLALDTSGKVTGFNIWTIDGKLPDYCL
jgi:hypothetical protein